MKKSIFVISLFVLVSLFIACAPDKGSPSSTKQQDYIINPPDFEELERQKTEWTKKRRLPINKKNPTQSKEDSIKAYIKELTHHFHLQEKQMKALEYIYSKYATKEVTAKAQNDSIQLNKIVAEMEKSIELVLGEHYYAKKGKFDEKYALQKPTPEQINGLSKYLKRMNAELNLNAKQLSELQSINNAYNKKLAKNRNDIALTKAIKAQNEVDLKKVLGDSLYINKLAFDKLYYNK